MKLVGVTEQRRVFIRRLFSRIFRSKSHLSRMFRSQNCTLKTHFKPEETSNSQSNFSLISPRDSLMKDHYTAPTQLMDFRKTSWKKRNYRKIPKFQHLSKEKSRRETENTANDFYSRTFLKNKISAVDRVQAVRKLRILTKNSLFVRFEHKYNRDDRL